MYLFRVIETSSFSTASLIEIVCEEDQAVVTVVVVSPAIFLTENDGEDSLFVSNSVWSEVIVTGCGN